MMPKKMSWDDIEKFMTDSPGTILSIYFFRPVTFLDDEPIILSGKRWGVNRKKFKQIESDVFGLVKFILRKNNDSRSSQAGIELDIMIARQVLGWYQNSDVGGPRAWWFKEGKEGEIEKALYLEHFSIDIKAAWILVEKFRLCVVPLGNGWTATRLGQILVDGETNKAPTAPHAICLAALSYASDCSQTIHSTILAQKPCYFCRKMAPVTFDPEEVFNDWSIKNKIICDWRSRFDGVRARLEWAALDETDKGCHPECALEYALREEGFT